MTTRRLTIEVVIDSRKAADAMRGLEREVDKFGGTTIPQATGAARGLNTALLAAGSAAVIGGLTAVAGAVATIAAVIGRASAEFASFDQAMRNVGAVSGATREELAALSEEALRLAKATRFSPEQTAQALYSLASSGQAAREQIESLPAVLDFAEAAQADLGKSTELIVSGLKSFGLAAADSRRVADVFTASIGASAFNAERLQLAMRNVGPSASAFGQTLEGTVAASAALVNVMLSGERAGTGLRAVFTELSDRGGKLGIAVRDAEGQFRPLVDIVRDMEAAGWDASRAVRDFGAEAGPALAVLLESGSGALQALESRLQSSGQAATVAAEQLDTLQGDLDQLASAQDEFWKVTGAQLEEGSRLLVQSLSAAVSEATSLVKENGEEISAAWLIAVQGIIESTRIAALAIARLIDIFDHLSDKVGGVANLIAAVLPPAVRHLYLLQLSLLQVAEFGEGGGAAETRVAAFFDSLRHGAEQAAEAIANLGRVTDLQLVASLNALGIAATNLRDLDELKAIAEALDKMELRTGPTTGVVVDERAVKAVAALRDALAQATRQKEFLIAAFQRGGAEIAGQGTELRRAERVVAAYNAVIVDGVAQLGLFDEALRLEGLRTQRDNLELLSKNFKQLAKNIEEAERAWEKFLEEGLFLGTDRLAEEDARRNPAGQEAFLGGYTEAEWAAVLQNMDLIDEAHFRVLDRQGKILDNLTEWSGAAYIIADAFGDVDSALADVFGAAGDFLDALTRINTEGGKLAATLAGLDTLRAVGNAVTGPNNYGAEGAAAGALIGALVGAYYGGASGAQAGAALGASAGGALGSFISKGVDEFLGAVEAESGRAVSTLYPSVANSLSQAGKKFIDSITRGVNEAVDLLGGELVSLPQLEVKIRDGIFSVFSNGIVARFESMEEAVDFAILQALREGRITGLSDEVRAALENSTAESFAAMAEDLNFAKWVEGLPEIGEAASQSATLVDQAVDEYRSALRKARDLGIDTGKIDQWFAATLAATRNGILGIVESNEERIRREAEAFNREVSLLEAEQRMREADLLAQQAMLGSEAELLKTRVLIREGMLDIESKILIAEGGLLGAKLAQLAAVQNALAAVQGILASLPDLISDKEIQDAINRSRGGGGKQRADEQQALRDEAATWGLSDIAAQLAEVGRFAEEFAERIKAAGIKGAEAAELARLAEEEEARRAEAIRADVRQTYYDVIAAAQGLSEIWGIKDQFRDLRQQILDAGLSAEETAERLAGLNWAEGVELQKVEFGIVDRLFGYLEGNEAFAERSLEFARMKVELEFAIIEAQLHLLGVFEKWAEVFNAGRDAALAALNLPDIEPPARQVRNHFEDAARDASRIAESFMQAKQSVAEFLNEMLVGTYGGVSPVGGVEEATRQFDEVLRQALTGNIGAIENFDDYGQTLLRLARDAYGSSPEFQAIYDYVLAAGRDVLGVRQGREGNLVFDERFYRQNEQQIDLQRQQVELLARLDRHLSQNRVRQGAA